MRPNVSCLSVNAKDGLEARPERVERRPVTFDKEIVVLQPGRQMVMVYDGAAGVPRLAHQFLGLVQGPGWYRGPGPSDQHLGPLEGQAGDGLPQVACRLLDLLDVETRDDVPRHVGHFLGLVQRHSGPGDPRLARNLLGLLERQPGDQLPELAGHVFDLVEGATGHREYLGRCGAVEAT